MLNKPLLLTFLLLTATVIVANAQNNQSNASAVKIEQFLQAVKRHNMDNEGKSNIYNLIATEEFSLRRFNDAIQHLNISISLNRNNIKSYIDRGRIYAIEKEYDKALDDFKTAETSKYSIGDQKAVALIDQAYVYTDRKQYYKSITADSLALISNPMLIAAYINKIDALNYTGQTQRALDDIDIALTLTSNPAYVAPLHEGRADQLMALNKVKDAINDYSFAININPKYGRAYWNRGAAYLRNGDYQLAEADYLKAIPYYTANAKATARIYNDLSQVEMGLQNYPKAVSCDSVSIALDSTNMFAHYNRGMAYMQNGDFKRSVDGFKYIEAREKDKARLAVVYSMIAHDEYFLKNYAQTITYCTKSIDYNPAVLNSFVERGRSYLKMNNKDNAMKDFNEIIKRDTSKKSTEYAYALFFTGKYDECIQIMQNSFLTTNDSFALNINYYNMACVYSLMNKPDEANNYLRKCIEGGYNKKYAIADPDLDNIRNTKDYKEILGI